MDFEWDEDKRNESISKHGVDFLDAALIFEHETLEWIDDREDYGEERVIALGRSGLTVFRVVFTMRGSDCRIITAQKASKRDQKRYFQTTKSR